MRTTKEADLNVALLQYVNKCRGEDDERALAHLGLDRHDAEAAASLNLGDLDHLNALPFPLLRENMIDRDRFRCFIEHVRRLRATESVRDALLARDAPLPLMHHFFGMEATEYAERGHRLGLVRPVGRPSEPGEAEEAIVWHACKSLGKPKDEELSPEDYLSLCETTGLSLRTLWLVLRRASARPQPPAAPPRYSQQGRTP